MYNLDIYPIHIHEGKAESALLGLIALTPPRKCARGRETDQLIALIHLTGKTSITRDTQQNWLLKKGELFYSSPGSVTNAMRLMAEAINNELLDRNLKKAATGSQVNGSLSLIVIRKDVVYTLIVGQAQVYILNQAGVVELDDRENHPKGLGVNQALDCNFAQNSITSNESILVAPVPNPAWTGGYLQGGAGLSTDALERRLLSQHPRELRAALIRLVEGNGLITMGSLRSIERSAQEKSDSIAPSKEVETPQVLLQPALIEMSGEDAEQTELPLLLSGIDQEETKIFPETMEEIPNREGPESAATPRIPSPKKQQKEAQRRTRKAKSVATGMEVNICTGKPKGEIEKVQRKTKDGKGGFLSRFLPDNSKGAPAVPRSMYLFLAIAIPLIVVAIAGMVYIRDGRTQQFEYYYVQGQQYAIQAEVQKTDPAMHSFNLQAALMYLEKAAQFGVTEDSAELQASVQKQLDEIQGVVRLELAPLNTTDKLGGVNISQMVATNTDLYLLDDLSGRAMHFDLTGNEYVLDEAFDCGPNPNNPLNSIGKLVDIISIPAGNSFGATIFAIDAYGNIEFCIPGDSGIISSLIAPDAGWQEIRSVSMYQNYLYVLDPGNNAVFSYTGYGILYEDKPTLFFDNVIPPMENTIDIEVNGDELYMLRSNGEMVECTYSHMKDYKLTECVDPAPYSDMRSGQSPQAISFPDSQFIQMRMTPAPDSSIYLLDTHGNGIYHFSLQRNLQKIFQPGFSDPGYAPDGASTSMALSPGKTVFMAFGNQVYYGILP